MSRNATYDGDVIGSRVRPLVDGFSGLPLGDMQAVAVAPVVSEKQASISYKPKKPLTDEQRILLGKLVDIAITVARRHRGRGITVTHIREEAFRRGILPEKGRGRELSFLSKIPERAGLVRSGRYERSDLEHTHGNLQAVWLAPEHAK